MKVGDLIRHRQSKKLALITKEFGPMQKKPYYYYNLLWVAENEHTVAPLDVLVRLWEVISSNERNPDLR